MLCIRELNDQFTIQGEFVIKVYRDNDGIVGGYDILAQGNDFECDKWDIDDDILEKEITYIYVLNGVLNIEVADEEEGEYVKEKNMGLEEILKELGAEQPFDSNGDLTVNGADAWEKLVKIVTGLHYIGAIKEKPDDIECYCDEIVRLGF